MTRREAREQAFILLFEKSFNNEINIIDIIDSAVEARMLVSDDFTVLLAQTACEQLAEIDSIIETNSIGWKTNRIPRVSLAILRLAVGEMKFIEDVPVSVSINEAVELAKKYATPEDSSFINGVLGAVAKLIEA